MYFDSHAHLCDRRFDYDRAEIIRTLGDFGVSRIMEVGCDLASSRRAVELAQKHPNIYAAVGSHPDDADQLTDETLDTYRQLAKNPKVRAIGEIGLDYHYEDVPREIQQQTFIRQLELARELQLPVIVHEREAHADGLSIIRRFPEVTGVFHCYSGELELARELVKLGWYIGFTGVITFKNARKAVEVAENIPLHRLLIETDCPYMAPEPHRGQRCDSRMVPLMAAKIGEIRGLSAEDVGKATAENACRLFRIEE